jgi:heptosyltransferase II
MKILVRGTNWIGDAVMSVPALRELRRSFPDDSITLHTRSWADGLFRDCEFIDDLVTFDPHKWRAKDVYDNSRFLSADRYDLAILLPNSFESALTTFLSKVPRRIGYNKDLRGLLLTDPIAVPEWKERQHEIYYYLELIGAVHKKVLGRDKIFVEPNITIEISDERKAAAIRLLTSHRVDPDKKLVILGPGSTNSRAKRWPAERFAQLANRLVVEADAQVIIIGSENEKDVANEVVAGAKVKITDLSGKTGLGDAAAILSVADLLISNDMGLAHVAPAVGTPTLTIFGPTDPITTRPFSPLADIIREDVDCSPCMLRDCPIDHRCMTRIHPNEVFERAAEMMFTVDDTNPVEPDFDLYDNVIDISNRSDVG